MAFFCAACLRVFHQSFSSAGNCSVLYVACIMYIVCVGDSTLSVHRTWTDVCLFVIMDIKLACFPSLYLRATHYGKQILSPSVDWQRKTTMMLFCKLSEVYTGGFPCASKSVYLWNEIAILCWQEIDSSKDISVCC